MAPSIDGLGQPMWGCDCVFCRMHLHGATDKELPGLLERAMSLKVERRRDGNFDVTTPGKSQAHVVVYNPNGQEGPFCKHIAAVAAVMVGRWVLGGREE